MSIEHVIEKIENLPHERTFVCTNCGQRGTASILSIHVNCERCSKRLKLRGYGSIGIEIEDVVDAVLEWMGTGARLEAVMRRKLEIDREIQREHDLEKRERKADSE